MIEFVADEGKNVTGVKIYFFTVYLILCRKLETGLFYCFIACIRVSIAAKMTCVAYARTD